MLEPLIQIVGGFVLLVWGVDRLVAGASATARNLGVSPLVVGLTIVGFGTSAPELVVSAVAAHMGNPALSVGNAVGSNIANIGLVLGITAMIFPLRIESNILKREFPVLFLVMIVVTWLMYDRYLNATDGIILLMCLLGMLGAMVYLGIHRPEDDPLLQEFEAEIPKDMSTSVALAWSALGLIILPVSSHILVDGAVTIARLLGVTDMVIGLTIVALGTSLPELAAAVTGAAKREDEIAIGNVLGSNMFNLLGVLGIAAIIKPVAIEVTFLSRDSVAMYLFTLVLFITAWGFRGPGRISRPAGILLLVMYLVYQGIVVVGTMD